MQEGCTRQKRFRYPVIIPIVYYEGKAEWTADMHLGDRIGGYAGNRDWIPDFRYELIRIHDYSDQELLDRENEMSLIMLISKIQNTADLERFIHIPPDRLDRIVKTSPEAVVNVMADVMETLCFKIDVSAEERLQCVQKVKERRMGYLFENMEKMSLQEERRKTEEERKRADREHDRAEEAQRRAEEEHDRAEEARRKTEEERKRADEAEEKLRLAEERIKLLKEKYLLDE